MCGDSYPVELIFGPLLHHQSCWRSPTQPDTIILETYVGFVKRRVQIKLTSYHRKFYIGTSSSTLQTPTCNSQKILLPYSLYAARLLLWLSWSVIKHNISCYKPYLWLHDNIQQVMIGCSTLFNICVTKSCNLSHKVAKNMSSSCKSDFCLFAKRSEASVLLLHLP